VTVTWDTRTVRIGHDGGMDVSETLLPGVGIRYEFLTKGRKHIGVIVYRDGNTEIVSYERDDPDACTTLLDLDEDEAEIIAEILGAPRFARKLADLTREIPGLHSEPIKLPSTSAYVGKTLGETHCRTLTGVSVVAIVRGEEVITSPEPDQLLLAGDVLVAIGTSSGIRKVHKLLELPA
jgi:TrkA domain protein